MQGPPTIARRHLLGGGLALLAAAAAGCALPVGLGSSRTHVKYWHFLGASDGIIMNEMVGAFAKENAGIFVEENVLAWGESYYAKIAMAGAAAGRPTWPPSTWRGWRASAPARSSTRSTWTCSPRTA